MRRIASASLTLLAVSACTPGTPAPTGPSPGTPPPVATSRGMPDIPRVVGPLRIRVVHPSGAIGTRADSSFIFGSVGRGDATLTINDAPVAVAPNGAFLAFLPVPADGMYRLSAGAGGESQATVVGSAPRPPAPPVAATPPVPPVRFPGPMVATVRGGRDTLDTGTGVAFGRRGLTGQYAWLLPRGAEVPVIGRHAGQLELRLGAEARAFMPESLLALGGPAPATPPAVTGVSRRSAPGWIDVVVGADSAAFLVEPGERSIALTLYGRRAPASAPSLPADAFVTGARWSSAAPDAARLHLDLSAPAWGYKVFYEAGNVVLRVRRPPAIDAGSPLRGRRIVIDPGHPPGGATGPTGLTEAEANLAISLRLAERLRAAGAEVVLTRTGPGTLSGTQSQQTELGARAMLAVERDAELFVSVHNNAFAEGTNPFTNYGTEVYYFHPHSRDLAAALNSEIAALVQIPNHGVKQADFAVVRNTWMPSVLTESLVMMFPQQEAALRDPAFLDRLAVAHLRGIESFLRGRAR